MNRIDRLQAIIIQLQTKKVVKAQEIANRFDISLRTVYRDIRAIEEAGVPIGAEVGIGYFLSENYSLPPIMLSLNEASSILLAGKFLPYLADKKIQDSFDTALHKIKAVLKTDQKEEIAKLEKGIHIAGSFMPKQAPNSIYIQEIQQSIINSQVIEIKYYSHYNKSYSERQLEPIALLHYATNWHLIAYCRLRNEFRDFRLDRIQELALLDEVYKRETNKDYQTYIERQKESINLKEIGIKVSSDIAEKIKNSKYWYGLISEHDDDQSVIMNFLYHDLEFFSKWILSFGIGIQICNPNELNAIVKKQVLNLYESYL